MTSGRHWRWFSVLGANGSRRSAPPVSSAHQIICRLGPDLGHRSPRASDLADANQPWPFITMPDPVEIGRDGGHPGLDPAGDRALPPVSESAVILVLRRNSAVRSMASRHGRAGGRGTLGRMVLWTWRTMPFPRTPVRRSATRAWEIMKCRIVSSEVCEIFGTGGEPIQCVTSPGRVGHGPRESMGIETGKHF